MKAASVCRDDHVRLASYHKQNRSRVVRTCDIVRLNLETRIILHRREMDPDELLVYQATHAFNYFSSLLDPMEKDGNCLHGI